MGAIVKLPETQAEWIRLAGVAIIAAGTAVAAAIGMPVDDPAVVEVTAAPCECDDDKPANDEKPPEPEAADE